MKGVQLLHSRSPGQEAGLACSQVVFFASNGFILFKKRRFNKEMIRVLCQFDNFFFIGAGESRICHVRYFLAR